jgi:hypothetical protein
MPSVAGFASALRRCLVGPRRPPAFAKPITVASAASAGCSPSLPLPTISSGCPSWWGPRRSHARNLPGPGENRQNRCKNLLGKRFSTTLARVLYDNSTKRLASTEFFRTLLNRGAIDSSRSAAEMRPEGSPSSRTRNGETALYLEGFVTSGPKSNATHGRRNQESDSNTFGWSF